MLRVFLSNILLKVSFYTPFFVFSNNLQTCQAIQHYIEEIYESNWIAFINIFSEKPIFQHIRKEGATSVAILPNYLNADHYNRLLVVLFLISIFTGMAIFAAIYGRKQGQNFGMTVIMGLKTKKRLVFMRKGALIRNSNFLKYTMYSTS